MRKRNHPLYVIKHMIEKIKQIIVPIFFLMIANLKNVTPLILIVGAVVLIILIILFAILNWKNSIYYIENETLIIEKGIFGKSKQAIAFDKITTMNESQELLEKIFGLATFKVDAGSATKGNEVKLTISHFEAEQLRQQMSTKSQNIATDTKAMENTRGVYSLNYKDLLKYAVTNCNLLLGIVLVSTLLQFINDIPVIGDRLEKYLNGWKNVFNKMGLEHLPIRSMIILSITILMVYLVVSFIISVIRTFVKYFGFTLSRQTSELQISYGLIDNKSFTLSADKITALYISYSLFGRLVGLGELKIENIGYGDEKGEVAILFPIIQKKKVDKLLREVLPEFLTQEAEWIRPHKRAKLSYIIRYAILPLIGAIVLTVLYKFGYLSFIVVTFMAICGYLAHQQAGTQTVGDKRVFTKGIFGKKISIVKNKFFQSCTVSQNPFQKRSGLVNIKYSYQSNNLGGTVGIKGMDEKTVECGNMGLDMF